MHRPIDFNPFYRSRVLPRRALRFCAPHPLRIRPFGLAGGQGFEPWWQLLAHHLSKMRPLTTRGTLP